MSGRLGVLLVLDGAMERQEVEPFLPEEALEIRGVLDGSTGVDPAAMATADVVVVACSGASEGVLELIRTTAGELTARPIVVLCEGSPNGFVGRAFSAGADDIVVLPEQPERIQFALEKAVARKSGPRSPSTATPAPMICVLGPKGGTGKTLTTSNLATTLAVAGHRPIVVDLDLQFGDVGLALGLTPERTIYDLVKSGGSLDAEKLEAFLIEHESGVRVLLAPVRPDQASAVKVEMLREVWRLLRTLGDYVIVDTPPEFTPEVIAAIDASTDVCIVGMLDSLSIKNTKLGLETLDLMGYDRDAIRVVLNRADTRVGISRDDVAGVLGREPDVLVPSDRDIPRSVNEGIPIITHKPRSAAATAFRALAGLYAPMEQSANGNGRGRNVLRRLSLRRNG